MLRSLAFTTMRGLAAIARYSEKLLRGYYLPVRQPLLLQPQRRQIMTPLHTTRTTSPLIDISGSRPTLSLSLTAKDVFLRALRQHSKGYVCFTSVHGIMEAQSDPALRKVYREALAVAPDGMPLVWAPHAGASRTAARGCPER